MEKGIKSQAIRVISSVIIIFCLVGAVTAATQEEIKEKKAIRSLLARMRSQNPVVMTDEQKRKISDAIEQARSGSIKLESIDAFNSYNFCLLANRMLGDLYKSHGCLHVSPINVYLLNTLLPIGSSLEIKDYNAKIDMAKAKDFPKLIEYIDYNSDLRDLKKSFASKSDVRTVVYPGQSAYVIYLQGEPFAGLSVQAGPQDKFYMYQYRDDLGYPVFDKNLAFPTPAGKFFIFRKYVNYVSSAYKDQTTIPMSAEIRKIKGKWMFEDGRDNWKSVPASVAADIEKGEKDRVYDYYDIIKDQGGNIVQARWASNTFGVYPIALSKDMRTMAPELVHTTCDLILDQYKAFAALLDIMSVGSDSFDECVASSDSFSNYKACFDFIDHGDSWGLDPSESGSYKIFNNMPLSPEESASLPKDVVIAHKVLAGKEKLTKDEEDLLVNEGIAQRSGGSVRISMEKIRGLEFYTYQYVVMIKKCANLYTAVRDNWDDLTSLRTYIVNDMQDLQIDDRVVYRRFGVDLMLRRVMLMKISLDDALDDLKDVIGL